MAFLSVCTSYEPRQRRAARPRTEQGVSRLGGPIVSDDQALRQPRLLVGSGLGVTLQPKHLTDVATASQRTVKPWFDGKLDFSPRVRDLDANGFVLVGGRLDMLNGQRVAAIVYRRQLHAINLFQWPGSASDSAPTSVDAGDGYTITHWAQGGMNYWAVSNLERRQMDAFATAFRQAAPLSAPVAR